MRHTPRVSVIMPAYNVEKYVGEAIESILNQTFTDFEFIIINDGSTDNTASIIAEYAKKDERIRFINRDDNRGFIATLNECLDNAVGEFIAKMDSDDISLPKRLEKQVAFLDSHADIGMVGAGLQIFGTQNKIYIRSKNVGLADFMYDCATTIIMARRNIIEKHNLRFEQEYFAAEDLGFYAKFAQISKIANLQEVLYLYRYHGGNVSLLKPQQQQQTWNRVKNEIAEFLTGNEYAFNKFTKMYRWIRICGLPIIKIKTYNLYRFKYYLLGKIPLIMTENGDIFLFGFIKIGAIR